MRNAGLDEAQAGINTARRNINNLRYADDTTLMEESEEELKSLLMKVKEESEKVGLKLNTQKTKIMASGPITSWQIDAGTVADYFLGSKITADDDCNHQIKRHWLLGRKAMINLDSVLKRRDITLRTEVCIVKAMVFPVVMHGCESWTTKKAEHQGIDAFKLCVLVKILESPLDSKEIKSVNPKGNQSWIFNGRTNAEALILWPPDEKSQLTGKDPGAGKDWGQAKKGVTEDEMVGWHHWFNGHEFEQTPGDDEGQGNLLCYSHGVTKSQTWLNDWTTTANARNMGSIPDLGRFHMPWSN